jgi:phenylacetic acid degradation operon negative regulatory protein
MPSLPALNALIQRFQQQTPVRASSLIVTLYGDAVEPHGVCSSRWGSTNA